MPCYHVPVRGGLFDGRTYGVAALTQTEARNLLVRRLRADGTSGVPGRPVRVGTWQAEPGTVLAY